MLYYIEIKETLSVVKEVEADNIEDAIYRVESAYKNQEIILDSENFVGVEFINAS